MQEKIITPNFLGKLFGNIDKLEIVEQHLLITQGHADKKILKYSDITDIPQIKSGVLGHILDIKTSTHHYRYSFLKKANLKQGFAYIEQQVINNITNRIDIVNAHLMQKSRLEYLRDSSINLIETKATPFLDSYAISRPIWQLKLAKNTLAILARWEICFPLSNGKHILRKHYENQRLKESKDFFDNIESNPLTENQRLSVIRNNDLNLVLAAAGTGKTSVMVAKALDLIKSGMAKSSEVLILAYNNDAAKELKERVVARGMSCDIHATNMPLVSTFHALGRKILKETNIPTYLSEFCDDPNKLQMWVTQWLRDYITASPQALYSFIKLAYQPDNPFDFKTKAEYDAYVRDNELRTLQGERVKSYQELVVANWLFLNGIAYEYKAPFVSKRRLQVGLDYKPDFHITNTNIYIEHFDINRQGETRPDIDNVAYNQSIAQKRALHKEVDTQLLEIFHYDWMEDNLENRLSTLMRECWIKTAPKSSGEVFDILQNMGFVDESSQRYLKCLQAMRVERLDKKLILSRLVANNIADAEAYSDLLDALQTSYTNELERQQCIDFDDMIIRSTDAMTSKQFTPVWRHILVDEFQDISMSRMDFLNALISDGPKPILTVVGDDWQSIYRFAGGKLELTTKFDELVGQNTLTKLDKTFRYNNSIADTAGTFVMQNPEQYKKQVTTHTQVDSSQVYLLDSIVDGKIDLPKQILQVVTNILKNDVNSSIAILARYRYLLEQAKQELKGAFPSIISSNSSNSENSGNSINNAKIKYWTFHSSKGLEADYCILVGFSQGKAGFPNSNKQEALVAALLPSLDTFPHSEERRLLYVALTRAKKKSYLIADPMAPSVFINELLSPKYSLHIVSKTFGEKYRQTFKCRTCTEGYLKLLPGKFGDFYSCTSGVACSSIPRVCDKCGSPSSDTMTKSICHNEACREEKVICDTCGRLMKLRESQHGKFYGCSGYGINNDPCKQTRLF
jgi:DNA helicase-4